VIVGLGTFAYTVNAGNDNDTICTSSGSDSISAGNGNDWVDAGEGNDTVIGDNGNDLLLGGAGTDQLDGGNGNDRLEGGEGNDMLIGQNGDDTLFGGPGNDSLTADNGNDVLDGGPGTDSLSGGAGNDTCRQGETTSSCETLPPNGAPSANAGPDQTRPLGSTVHLDGTGSSDPDGDSLTFQWTLTSKPATSTATLSGATTALPTFVLDTAGTYQLQLIVSDGNLTSTADIVIVSTTNSAPVAEAGADQSGAVSTVIHLDGGGSSDVDGNPLTYQWSFVSKPTTSTATLTTPASVTPQFTIDKPGTYVVQLIVNDGTVASAADTVTISTLNSKPVANAGTDQSGTVGTTMTLDGTQSSDVDGDTLTYQWAITTKPTNSTATLSDPTAVNPTFILDKPGTYTAQLIVNDGTVNSDADTITISTLNTKPTADAGDDKHGVVGATVTLDGTLSSDPDGDAITYQWSLTTKPTDSTTSLQNPTTANPSFVLDKPGTYTGQLIVNDGQLDSDPDTVTVTTLNSKPVADAGADQTGQTGTPVSLNGNGSNDVDNNPLTYFWSFTSKPEGSTATLSNDSLINPTFTPDLAGTYVVQLIVNDGQLDSDPDTVSITVPDTTPPPPADLGKITVGPITNGQVTITGSAGSVEGGATVTITNPRTNEVVTVTANADGSFTAQLGAQASDTLSIVVTDGAGNASAPGTVTIGSPTPFTASVAASAPIGAAPFAVTFTTTASLSTGLTYAWEFGDGTTASGGTTQTHTYTTPGTYTAQVIVSNGAMTTQVSTPVRVDAAVGPLPPDPATVAPPINRTVATSLWRAAEFLYTGANPIQTGVAPGIIAPRQAAVLRGKVQTATGAPLSGVTITVLDHPEFGQTLTRSDGAFDFVINGGGQTVITYTKAGYIPVQRQITPEWGDYAHLPEVVMIARDQQVTTIDLAANVPMQVARGSVVTDSDGSRQVTMLFPQGTQATMQLPNGGTQSLSTLHVRATEFTVGEHGPKAMPGELPATSGYTYAVELGVDEALVNGKKVAGQDVVFTQPVIVYVDNFLHFPVGGAVPVGYYDNDQGVWVPWDNGRIIKVLGLTAGVADLDTDGDDAADDAATLTALGVTEAERAQLATLYTPGQSLWRVPVTHFSWWDCNWPYGPPPDGSPPNPWSPPANPGGPLDEPNGPPPLPEPGESFPEDRDAVGGGEPFAADFASTQVGDTCPIPGSIVLAREPGAWRSHSDCWHPVPLALSQRPTSWLCLQSYAAIRHEWGDGPRLAQTHLP
jgi:PKD repeat protein